MEIKQLDTYYRIITGDIGKLHFIFNNHDLERYKIDKKDFISYGLNGTDTYYVVIEKILKSLDDEAYIENEDDEFLVKVFDKYGVQSINTIEEMEQFFDNYTIINLYDEDYSGFLESFSVYFKNNSHLVHIENFYRQVLTHKILNKYVKFYPQYTVNVLRSGMKQSMFFKINGVYFKLSNGENMVVLEFPRDIVDNEILASKKAEYHPRYELAYEIQEIKIVLKKFLDEVNTLFVHYKVREWQDIVKIINEGSTYFKEYEHLTTKPHYLKIAFEELKDICPK